MFKNEQTKFVIALLPISGNDIVGSNPGMEFSQFINSPKSVIVAPACSRVRYRRPIFRPSVNIYVDVLHLCQS